MILLSIFFYTCSCCRIISHCFILLVIYTKKSWISDTEYSDPSSDLNLSFHVETDILNLYIFFHVEQMLRFDKATYLSLSFKFISSVRLSYSLWWSDLAVSIFYNNCIKLIKLLYTFLVILFAQCNKYIIW